MSTKTSRSKTTKPKSSKSEVEPETATADIGDVTGSGVDDPAAGLKFVVTGCARSGTKYAAHLLTLAGISCGHEDVFNRWDAEGHLPADWRRDGFDGESSYVAAPYVGELADAGLTVVHLVRPPLAVIGSIGAAAWLADLTTPYVAYVATHAPGIAEQPPGPRRAAAYWLGWNALVADHAPIQWRTDTVNEADVHALANRIGVTVETDRVADAIARTPTTINHKRPVRPVALDELGPLADAVATAADRYGVALA